MQCVSDLAKLRDSVISRVRGLRSVSASVTSPLASSDKRTLAFVTLELDNLIIVALRQYTKSSLLRSRTASGLRITASVNPMTVQEAAAYVFRSINPTRYHNMGSPAAISERNELSFRNPKDAERVLLDYSASNISNLATALSLNAEVFAEAKVFRHFFAHRARNTADAVAELALNLGLAFSGSPEEILIKGRPNVGIRVLDGWLADVENFFDLAA